LIRDIEQILLSEEEIQAKILELGKLITDDFRDKNPLVICILKGAFIFMSDLVKKIEIPLQIDFMAVSSYGHSSTSSGEVKIIKDLDIPVDGRHVLIVEDIIDSGLTLNYLIDVLERRNAASISIVALFNKMARRSVSLTPNYIGFELPNAFVVGYGLDYAEKYRNLPFIGVLKSELYTS
jgi:hypoxanthine phosphoribosyltransferase